jgi:hypothetical protein
MDQTGLKHSIVKKKSRFMDMVGVRLNDGPTLQFVTPHEAKAVFDLVFATVSSVLK